MQSCKSYLLKVIKLLLLDQKVIQLLLHQKVIQLPRVTFCTTTILMEISSVLVQYIDYDIGKLMQN